jgi:ubiquinone/menaquinone biosynthesis C-methylase UbiE
MTLDKLGYEYLLGDGDKEIDRLRFQHTVWGPVTSKFFDRIGVAEGWKVLDVGSGPGFVSMDLRERIGPTGHLTALEPSESFRTWFSRKINERGWTNLEIVPGNSFEVDLPPASFDLIFVRWVIGFVSDPREFLMPLIASLKPGGLIAIQDYVHEGCALFPQGGAWDRFPEMMRQWWRSGGGDPYVTAKIPALMRQLELNVTDYTPNTLTGGPDSSVTAWMERFLYSQLSVMVERKIASRAEAEAVMADWMAHRSNPDTIFYSPFVVDVAGRKENTGPASKPETATST